MAEDSRLASGAARVRLRGFEILLLFAERARIPILNQLAENGMCISGRTELSRAMQSVAQQKYRHTPRGREVQRACQRRWKKKQRQDRAA